MAILTTVAGAAHLLLSLQLAHRGGIHNHVRHRRRGARQCPFHLPPARACHLDAAPPMLGRPRCCVIGCQTCVTTSLCGSTSTGFGLASMTSPQ
eukprot:scaffold46095_cov74-Phaeocystis_antarctica.AAC.2